MLFRSSCPSPNPSYRFWFLALTFRSSRPAFCGRLTSPVSRLETAILKPMFYSPAFTFSSVIRWVFRRVPGFALGSCASFKLFWPLALVQQALPAIILQALRRLRGAVLFRSLRPSSSWGFPCWLLGLTVQSSRPAFGGRLTFVR